MGVKELGEQELMLGVKITDPWRTKGGRGQKNAAKIKWTKSL
jgi:hypothetical protein